MGPSGLSRLAFSVSKSIRALQSGRVHEYLSLMAGSLVLLAVL